MQQASPFRERFPRRNTAYRMIYSVFPHLPGLVWLVGFGDEGAVISGSGTVAVLRRVLSSVPIPEAVEISAR